MIELQGVGVARAESGDREPLFADLSLTVDAGEVVVVSGAASVGKTTLLKLIYAAELAAQGSVAVFGRNVAKLRRSSVSILRRRIGVIPEDLQLLDDRTVFENVSLVLEIIGASRRDVEVSVAGVLGQVGLGEKMNHRIDCLSLAERQRVAIARAFVGQPPIILADEPTSHAPGEAEVIATMLAAHVERGGAAIVTTRDESLLAASRAYGWRLADLARGTLSESAFVDEIVSMGAAADEDELENDLINIVPFPIAARAAGAGGRGK